jgi:pyruvoyl-dependent arginine decarboxylase (PvlArgDC)
MPKHLPALYCEIGCRIPKEYFWVIGGGESYVGIEVGSYEAALDMAGIENYNVMLSNMPQTVRLLRSICRLVFSSGRRRYWLTGS